VSEGSVALSPRGNFINMVNFLVGEDH